MRPLPHDVQRDLHFYRTVVAFRNAIERMQVIRGTVDDPDRVSLWWGFGYLGRPRGQDPSSDFGSSVGFDPPDDDGLAGSRVPRRPFGDAGAASAEAEIEYEAGSDAVPVRQASA